MKHLILFDIDGTLVDSADFDGVLFTQAVFDVLGVKVSSDWTRYHDVTDSGILHQIIEENGLLRRHDQIQRDVSTQFATLTAKYLAEHPHKIHEIKGASAFLKKLQDDPNYVVGIATGGWAATALMKLQAVGINVDEGKIGTANDATRRIDIMQIAEARVVGGSNLMSRTYFGDGPWDRAASATLGFKFIAIGRQVEAAHRFDDFSNQSLILGCVGGPRNRGNNDVA